jgi:hypothetical protein
LLVGARGLDVSLEKKEGEGGGACGCKHNLASCAATGETKQRLPVSKPTPRMLRCYAKKKEDFKWYVGAKIV